MEPSDSDKCQFWKFVSLDQFRPPSPSIDRTLKKRFWGLFSEKKPKTGRPDSFDRIERPTELEELRLHPRIKASYWDQGAHALDIMLRQSAFAAPDDFLDCGKAVVGPPFGGHGQTLRQWAKQHRFPVVDPPEPEKIMEQDESLFQQFYSNGPKTVHVVPELERFFLRNVKGIALVRRLFAQLWEGKLGRVVFGCDSWAWAFLCRVLGQNPAPACVAQALSADSMAAWLAGLAFENSREPQRYAFRSLENGAYVLPPPDKGKDDSDKKFNTPSDIKLLNEYCRGNPGVALEFWKRGFKSAPENEPLENEQNADNSNTDAPVVWIVPWEKLPKPAIPEGFEREHGLLLHTLLLHGGLHADMLETVLPYSRFDISRYISFLGRSELIEIQAGFLKVTPFSFPAVREYLKGEGYLREL